MSQEFLDLAKDSLDSASRTGNEGAAQRAIAAALIAIAEEAWDTNVWLRAIADDLDTISEIARFTEAGKERTLEIRKEEEEREADLF